MPTNHFISLSEATTLIKRFKGLQESLLCDEYQNQEVLPSCETFSREAFDEVLSRDGCTGLRIYLGMDETNKLRLVIVGVDANDQDMISVTDQFTVENEIIENGIRCPHVCPPDSPLNT